MTYEGAAPEVGPKPNEIACASKNGPCGRISNVVMRAFAGLVVPTGQYSNLLEEIRWLIPLEDPRGSVTPAPIR